jgi:hypothetical protein
MVLVVALVVVAKVILVVVVGKVAVVIVPNGLMFNVTTVEGHGIKDCHKKKRDESGNTLAVAAVATANNNEQADVLFVAMEGFGNVAGVWHGYFIDPDSDYSTDEDPSNPGACYFVVILVLHFLGVVIVLKGVVDCGFYESMSVEKLALHQKRLQTTVPKNNVDHQVKW